MLGDYKDAPNDEARQHAVVALEDWLEVEAPDLLAYLEAKLEAEQQMKGPIYLDGRGVYEQLLANIQAEALAFARVFYAALLGNETVASAARQARLAARAAGDPTWLAHSVYARPNARLAWDGSRG